MIATETAGAEMTVEAGKTNCRGRLSTVDLLIGVTCFVKKINNISSEKTIVLSWLKWGGQQYLAFPLSRVPW